MEKDSDNWSKCAAMFARYYNIGPAEFRKLSYRQISAYSGELADIVKMSNG